MPILLLLGKFFGELLASPKGLCHRICQPGGTGVVLVRGRRVDCDIDMSLSIDSRWIRELDLNDLPEAQMGLAQPVPQAIPGGLAVRIGHKSADKPFPRFFHLALLHQRVAPITVSNFLIRIDLYRLGKPLAGIVPFLQSKVAVPDVHGRVVQFGIDGQGVRVFLNGVLEVALRESGFAPLHGLFHFFVLRKRIFAAVFGNSRQ